MSSRLDADLKVMRQVRIELGPRTRHPRGQNGLLCLAPDEVREAWNRLQREVPADLDDKYQALLVALPDDVGGGSPD